MNLASETVPAKFDAPPRLPTGAVLFVAVLAMSWAGPLVRFASAPALAVSAWRLLLSVALLWGYLLLRRRPLPRLTARDLLLAVSAGALLAAHFWSWIASLALTSVASSVVLVNMQPLFVGLLSMTVLREPPSRRQWIAISIGLAGALVIGWGDFHRGPAPLLGDGLAIAGAAFVSGYYIIGRELRQRLDTAHYVSVVYGAAAATLVLVITLHPGVALTGYPPRDWWIFMALAAGPMLIGHTGVNYALRYVRAYVANLAILGEPILATLIAWQLPGIRETPGVQTLVGGMLILMSVALATIGARAGTKSQERQ